MIKTKGVGGKSHQGEEIRETQWTKGERCWEGVSWVEGAVEEGKKGSSWDNKDARV